VQDVQTDLRYPTVRPDQHLLDLVFIHISRYNTHKKIVDFSGIKLGIVGTVQLFSSIRSNTASIFSIRELRCLMLFYK
jgi:hypothetical protein